MGREPYFPFYYSDFFVSVAEMTNAEVGAYIRLLIIQAESGSVHADPERHPIRYDGEWETLKTKFPLCEGGRRRNPRLHQIIEDRKVYLESRRKSGSKGGRAKWISDDKKRNEATRSERLAEARRLATHLPAEWEEMKEYFDYTCLVCGKKEPEIEIVKDHIVPLYQKGSDGLDNIQPLCRRCNSVKGADNIDRRHIMPDKMPSEFLAKCLPSTSTSTSTSTTISTAPAINEYYLAVAKRYHEQQREYFPDKSVLKKGGSSLDADGAVELEKFERIDGWAYEKIVDVLKRVLDDPEWRKNIISLRTVRHKGKNGCMKLENADTYAKAAPGNFFDGIENVLKEAFPNAD